MPQDIRKLKQHIVPILREAGVTRSSMFGSFARGDAGTDSDLDLLVELPDRYSLLDVVHLKQALQNVIGRDVDLVEYDAVKPALRNSIFEDQIEII